VHPLEDASFDAWIKAYRPDENSVNSTVSYYLKGEVACLLLDLEMRHRSGGRASLDDVVRRLWREYGAKERPVPEDGLPAIFAEVAGTSLDDCFAEWVRTGEPLPVNEVLARAGLAFERSPRESGPRASLGVRVSSDGGRAVVDAVLRGTAAHRAGLDPRDEIVAIGDRRVEGGRLDAALSTLAPGARVSLVVARDGRMRTLEATLDEAPATESRIAPREGATDAQKALYAAWMGDAWERAPSRKR
jgi:predicted metalloprotease with PDZ domain